LIGLDKLDLVLATSELTDEAARLDLELRDDDLHWTPIEAFGERALTPAGRHSLRKMIDDEKTRRREVKAWWWKTVIIPAITALTGLAGVITGLVAVLRK
jgi:hypothetical protein